MKTKILGFFGGVIAWIIIIFFTNNFSPAGGSGWLLDIGNSLNQYLNPGNVSPTLNMISVLVVPFILPALLFGSFGALIGNFIKRKETVV